MQVMDNVRRFPTTLVATVVIAAALAFATSGQPASIGPADSAALVTAVSPNLGVMSPHRPLASRAAATSSKPAPCKRSVQFHKRVAAYCLDGQGCTRLLRAPGRIRPSPAADRSAVEILNALRKSC